MTGEKYTRRKILKGTLIGTLTGMLGSLLAACDTHNDKKNKAKFLVPVPVKVDNAMWSWWTKPILLRDYSATKNKTYLVFTESVGTAGLAVIDHLAEKVDRYTLSGAFSPDDHNAGCVVTGNGKVAVFLQGRNVIGEPGEKMFYVEFNEGESPEGIPMKSFDFATPPQRSNYPNVFNSAGEIFVLSRNQQALGNQWHYVLGTWPLTTFSAPKAFFASKVWTWPYFAVRRSTVNKDVFNFALGWHPFDGKHHDIYYGEIHRNGLTAPWDVVSKGTVVGNMTTGAGLPFDENSFEKVYECPDGYSTRLFESSDDCVVFAVFDPANNVADYRYAIKENGVWSNYSICSGGLPFHGQGIRNYYGGVAISERSKFILTVCREEAGQWIVEEYFSTNKGKTWAVAVGSTQVAPPGLVYGRPMEEVLSEEAHGVYKKELISMSWLGTYSPSDYTVFNTNAVSIRHPLYKQLTTK